jgi:hypothetical protein
MKIDVRWYASSIYPLDEMGQFELSMPDGLNYKIEQKWKWI